MNKNKKGNFGLSLYGFFFVMMISTAIMLFLGIGMHFITYDYVIEPIADTGSLVLDPAGQAYAHVQALKLDYFGKWTVYDLLFLFMMLSLFIESCWTAIKARRTGLMSFLGLLTIGNLFFVFLLSYAINIRNWILNEFFFKIITENFTARWTFTFFENSYIIAFAWFTILVVLSFIDIPAILERVGIIGGEDKGEIQE